MINLDPDFEKELAAIYQSSGVLSIARKRLADAQAAGDEHEIKLQMAAVVGAEALTEKAYEDLGRAIFKEYQRLTGEFPKVKK